jgi:hypothetical protein
MQQEHLSELRKGFGRWHYSSAARPKRRRKRARRSAEEKEAEAQRKALAKREETIEKMRNAFFATPAGQARTAFERGDAVFQYSIDVHTTQSVVIPMVGAYTTPKVTSDPTEILNSVCHEGWELVNGSFVFLELGSESRDKFLASGQQVAVRGTIIGYYLFKRSEENKKDTADPWDAELIPV